MEAEQDKLQDKRVRRTKKLLKESLTALMIEKDIQHITVKDVVERADMNRGTFYLHYRDVFDLANQIEDEALAEFSGLAEAFLLSQEGKGEAVGGRIFDWVYGNLDLSRALFLSPYSSRFVDKLAALIIKSGLEMRERVEFSGVDSTTEVGRLTYESVNHFIANGLIGVLLYWLRNEEPMSRDTMVPIINNILYGTLSAMAIVHPR